MYGNHSIPTADGRGGRSTSRPLLAALAVLVLILAASCGGASGTGGGQQPAGSGGQEKAAAQQGQTEQGQAKEKGALGREPLGDAGAPVVLTEYADYQ